MYTIKSKHNKNVRNYLKKEDSMYKYLYIYNYSPHEQDLCEMEFRQIFHEPMKSKYYFSNQDFDYTRSVYIRGKLNILYSSNHIEDIVFSLEQDQLCYYEFKVIYLKNEITSMNYDESLECCKKLALPIAGSVNMQNPKVVFAVTKIHDLWHFGIYEDTMIWNLRMNKPHSYSHSLNTRDARTIVNIAVGNDLNKKVVDPCCGIGTVVLEALSMSIDIHGFDINRYVSYQARLNLEHFGYDPLLIQKRDMCTLEEVYDVVIMDIPYGVYSPFTYQQQLELLKAAKRLAPRLLLVSHISMNQELIDLGYQIIDQATIIKGNFQRFMTLCEEVKK